MAQNPFCLDAWTRARNRFLEDLTDEEQVCMDQKNFVAAQYQAREIKSS